MDRLLIVEDHAIVREGLKRIFSECDDLRVAGEAASGEEAIEQVQKRHYDAVILDLSMPGRGGMDALGELRALDPNLPILVLSMHAEEQYARRCLQAGADGYVMKERPPAELITAVRKVIEGGKYITPALAERLASQLSDDDPPLPHETLSPREDQVMRAIAKGKALKDIAEEFALSVKTISTYKKRLFEKLNVQNQAELIRYAMENKLV